MRDTRPTFWVCVAFAITPDDGRRNVDMLILRIRKLYTDLGFLTEDFRNQNIFPAT